MRFRRALIGLVLALAAQQSQGWSEPGHIAIAEAAVQDVPVPQRQELNAIAQQFRSASVTERYSSVSDVASISAWLDRQRGLTVEEIFSRYGQQVPEALSQYAQDTTDDWHYSNKLYRDSARPSADTPSCDHVKNGQLNNVLPRLREAFVSAQEPKAQAIVLAMLVHLVADAHQPLHSITRLEEGCHHDRGGNGFCVTKTPQDRCELNLHRAWDQGFGVFSAERWQDSLRYLERYDSVQQVDKLTKSLRPRDWQSENFALAPLIYAIPEGKLPTAQYRAWAQQTALERAGDAAVRLTHILSALPVDE